MGKGSIFILAIVMTTVTVVMTAQDSLPLISGTKECKLVPFVINTTDILEDIIHPKTVSMGLCSGSCTTEKPDPDLDSPLHTYYKSLLGQQESCCVPVKYRPLNVIALGRKNKHALSLIKLPDLIVANCGCR